MSSFSSKFSAYTMTELNEFLEDDEKLTKMVQEMDEMQEVQQSKEKTLVNNLTLAEQNLALQPRLEHKKEELTKRYNGLQESFESYQLRKSTLGLGWTHALKGCCPEQLGVQYLKVSAWLLSSAQEEDWHLLSYQSTLRSWSMLDQ